VPGKKKGLGSTGTLGQRLGALGLTENHFQSATVPAVEIDVNDVHPNPRQARRVFHEEALQTLAASIKQYGVVQPVVVRQLPDRSYELIAGERRWRAARMCGLKTIPAVVREYAEAVATEISLIENLQREDLDVIEEALAYQMLLDTYGLTQEQAAEKVGKSRPHVANMLRLLRFPEPIRAMLSDGTLTVGQARPLLQIQAADIQLALAEKIRDNGVSARQVEEWVRKLMAEQADNKKERPEPDAFVEAAQDRMKMYLGTPVAIKVNRRKKAGKIEITFSSETEFERLLALLTQEEESPVTKDEISFSL